MEKSVALEVFDKDEPAVDEPFQPLVGHLMWLANQTRPDILNAVRAVARYCQSPKAVHWNAVLRMHVDVR